jgi:hypothetical protein
MHWLYNRDPKNWRRRNELSIGAQYNNPDAKPIQIKQELAGIVGIDLKKIPTELLEQFEKCLNG